MRKLCLLIVLGLATWCVAVEFESRDLRTPDEYDNYRYGGGLEPDESSRTHHKKQKLQKKLKKRLLLQCLLQAHHNSRRRRDTDHGTGRFLLPVVLQSTNVHVNDGGYGNGGHQQGQYYGGGSGGGCMQMLGGNNHGPLTDGLGSLAGAVGSLPGTVGSLVGLGSDTDSDTDSRNRYVDWDRYAKQFHRNFVRPLYRLF